MDKTIDMLIKANEQGLLYEVLADMMTAAKARLNDKQIRLPGNIDYLVRESYNEWIK